MKSNKGRREPFGLGGLETEIELGMRRGPRQAGEKEGFILDQGESLGKNPLFLLWAMQCH